MHNISCTIFTNLHALISPLFQVTHTQTNNLNLKHISLSPIETFFCSIHFPLKFSHTQKWQQSGAYCAIAIVHVRNHDCGMSTHLHVQVHVCKENITQPTDWNVNQILRNAAINGQAFRLWSKLIYADLWDSQRNDCSLTWCNQDYNNKMHFWTDFTISTSLKRDIVL